MQCTLDQSPNQYIIVDGNWKSWKDIVDISMNEEILAAVKSDGTVVWDGGRRKDYDFLNDPSMDKEIKSWKDVVQVSACHDTIAVLCKDGLVKMTGGLITEDLEETDGFKQISVYDAFFGLRTDGTVYCCAPYTYEGQTWKYETDSWTNIQQVSAGFDYAVGLKEDGTVVATGNKESGACDVEGWTDIEEVAGFFNVIIGLKADGSIVYAGYERDLLPVEATNIHN